MEEREKDAEDDGGSLGKQHVVGEREKGQSVLKIALMPRLKKEREKEKKKKKNGERIR